MREDSPSERDKLYNARIGRYQLHMGKIEYGPLGPNHTSFETMFRIDTATGQTWYLSAAGPSMETWHPVMMPPSDAQFMAP